MKKYVTLFIFISFLLLSGYAQSKCPVDKPLFDGKKCYSCDDPKTLNFIKNCSKLCPNRREEYECGPSCILKNSPGKDYTYISCKGWIKKCPKGYFQEQMYGECYSCKDIRFDLPARVVDNPYLGKGIGGVFEEGGLEITKEECLSCNNTQWTERGCYPKCPKDKPLVVDGRCESCALTERSGYVVAGCEKCPNRFQQGDGCYLKCPTKKPILGLDTGECFSCSDKMFNDPTWQPRDYKVMGCSKCPNKIKNTFCED